MAHICYKCKKQIVPFCPEGNERVSFNPKLIAMFFQPESNTYKNQLVAPSFWAPLTSARCGHYNMKDGNLVDAAHTEEIKKQALSIILRLEWEEVNRPELSEYIQHELARRSVLEDEDRDLIKRVTITPTTEQLNCILQMDQTGLPDRVQT